MLKLYNQTLMLLENIGQLLVKVFADAFRIDFFHYSYGSSRKGHL